MRLQWIGQGGAILGVLGVAAATALPDLPGSGRSALVLALLVFGASVVIGAVGVVHAERARRGLGERDEVGS